MPVEDQSEKAWKMAQSIDDSILTDLFSGQLINRVVCKNCEYESFAFDNFMDLSIEIPESTFGSISLNNCMK